jgi:hypothetical protein
MYLAEIHGKLSSDNENKEDILTSNVFSFFKYTDREVFFYPLLRSLGLQVSIEDCKQAEFIFWPTYPDHTEPDLVILVGKYYLLVEDKYHSGFSKETQQLKHQIEREVNGGLEEAKNLGRDFKILTVTADYYRTPEIFDGIPDYLEKEVIWINWQGIAFLIYKIIGETPDIQAETKLFAEDLYNLFLKKNLRNFEGVNALPHVHISGFTELFFNAKTAQYRGDFIGFIQALESNILITKLPKNIFYSQKQSLVEALTSSGKLLTEFPGKIFYGG